MKSVKGQRAIFEIMVGVMIVVIRVLADDDALWFATSSADNIVRLVCVALVVIVSATVARRYDGPRAPRYALVLMVVLGVTDLLQYAGQFQEAGRDILVAASWLFPLVLFEILVASKDQRLLLRSSPQVSEQFIAIMFAAPLVVMLDADVLDRFLDHGTVSLSVLGVVVGITTWFTLRQNVPRIVQACLLAVSLLALLAELVPGTAVDPEPVAGVGVIAILGYFSWFALSSQRSSHGGRARHEPTKVHDRI